MDDLHLSEMIRRSKQRLAEMTPEEREAMRQQQRDGWVKSEMQWAKDFREGKCERD
jgi:hypothetical protein